jgi:hypothetical protein
MKGVMRILRALRPERFIPSIHRQRFQLHALLREELRNFAPLGELQAAHAAAVEMRFSDWEQCGCECGECLPEVIRLCSIYGRRVSAVALWG